MSVSWVEMKIGLEKLCFSAKLFVCLFNLRIFVRVFIGEEGLLPLSLREKMVMQNNYRAKLWNVFNVFFFKKKKKHQLEINHFYGHNKISSLKHAL